MLSPPQLKYPKQIRLSGILFLVIFPPTPFKNQKKYKISPIFKIFVAYVLVERSGKKSYIGVLLIVVTKAILVYEAPVTKKLVQLARTKTGHSSTGNHPPTKTKQKSAQPSQTHH